jgi:hypothetical protein
MKCRVQVVCGASGTLRGCCRAQDVQVNRTLQDLSGRAIFMLSSLARQIATA